MSNIEEVKDLLNIGQDAFDTVKITIASPDTIRSWSRGEVKNPETINYRTFKPEPGGLFCQKIFGPVRDYECACGKYKRIKNKGIVCDRCGVEVTIARVRRERMGHIELAVPVSHIWFLKSMPSRLGLLLDMTARNLERVIYYENYMVTDPGRSSLEIKALLTEAEYRAAQEEYGEDAFTAKMGAEALRDVLATLQLEPLVVELQEQMHNTRSKQIKKKIAKRLKVITGFIQSGARPEWMVLEALPVIPPDLRPLVPLDGGRFATSDLNDLYRRVINRNNRLRSLMQLKTPDVIIHNERRMLQEAVDALFDNGRHGKPVNGPANRPLKSLSDMLKGKQGRFRQNLLGKRVDYSGRSVIVVGPNLKLNQCGLPKKMALVLFEPFIIRRLKELNFVHTVRGARKMIEKRAPEVWDILEQVTKGHPVLLNRAPTLHRLSIQAFEPVLIEGDAIRLHPLVCTAYNADFDGDQMAVHIPLSLEAILECKLLMMATHNIFSPSSGKPILTPSQDIVLGSYYLTLQPKRSPEPAAKDSRATLGGKPLPVFGSIDEVVFAESSGTLGLHDWVVIPNPDFGKYTTVGLRDRKYLTTTVGRCIFSTIWPRKDDEAGAGSADAPVAVGFPNYPVTKGKLGDLILNTYKVFGKGGTVRMLDDLKGVGYRTATKAGTSIGIFDMIIPQEKPAIVRDAREKITEVESQYKKGVITDGERSNKIIDIWTAATDSIAKAVFKLLEDNGESIRLPAVTRELNQLLEKIGMDEKARADIDAILLSGIRPEEAAAKANRIVQAAIQAKSVRVSAEQKAALERSFAIYRNLRSINPVYIMMDSGARGNKQQVRQLCGARGLMAKPSGEIIERPILASFREGLSVLEYFISTHGARKGLADTALKTADAGYLTRKLCDVAMDCIISRHENTIPEGTGIRKAAISEGDDVIVPLRDRIIGRCPARDVVDPASPDKFIVKAGEVVTEEIADRIDAAGIEEVTIMSPLTHASRSAIPAEAYGINPATNKMVETGTAVGIIAAQSIGEPGTQLTMRTFHVGGVASSAAKSNNIVLRIEGRLRFKGLNIVQTDRFNVVLNKTGSILVVDENELELESFNIPAGAILFFNDGDKVVKGDTLAQWDPHNIPIVAQKSGVVSFQDMIPGVTVKREIDTSTGRVSTIVIEHKDDLNPCIIVRQGGVRGPELARIAIPTAAQVVVAEGDEITAGTLVAKTPRQASKTMDITGGLPRVAELFEARRPKDAAEMAKIDGIVEFDAPVRSKKKIIVRNDETGEVEEHLIPHGKHIIVQVGDHVAKGQHLTEGAADPHEVLEILGPTAVQEYLLSEIQKVYRLQGVTINDKHIEVIISQMLRKVRVTDPGDTDFFWGEQIDKRDFQAENARIADAGGHPASAEPVLLGITKASIETESFISAASFQETTRVLTDAATLGKRDILTGFKENVIMGNLIPAGTGLPQYRKLKINTFGAAEYSTEDASATGFPASTPAE